jgi:DNA mismatch repair protein MutL
VKLAIEESFFESSKMVFFPKMEVSHPPLVRPIEIKEERSEPLFQLNEERLIQEEIEVIGFYDDIAFVKIPQTLPFFSEERLVFVHTQRLDAKIQFGRILDRLKEGKESEMEQLLFPEVLRFSKGEEEMIIKHEPLFRKIGIAIRPFGKESFMIDAISPLFSLSDVKKIIQELLTEFAKEFSFENIGKIVIQFRPPKIVSKEAVKHLLQEVLKREDPFYAPNGKLIMKPFNKEEFF